MGRTPFAPAVVIKTALRDIMTTTLNQTSRRYYALCAIGD